jgi:UDP-glucose-4-epimerase GalE
MNSVLVTGGAGYIGSHTCKTLARSGYMPVVIDNLSTGHAWAVKWGPLIEGDISDLTLVRNTLRKYRIDAVIHFAANASVAESMANPFKYLHGNVHSTLTLLEAMREADVRKIVFSSTCATYGIPRQIPIAELSPQIPVNPYGESKLFIERALRWYEEAFGFTWAALRYFNAAGADQEGEIGECHTPETHLIPILIGAALRVRSAARIMGTDYPTPDGTAIRDYIHVEDLADAHYRALKHLERGAASLAVNLGTGRGYSVREVIAAIEHVCGISVPAQESERRPGDPPELVADNRLARDLLSWDPHSSDIHDIVRTAYEWHRSESILIKTGD